jgi:hypothetical protein
MQRGHLVGQLGNARPTEQMRCFSDWRLIPVTAQGCPFAGSCSLSAAAAAQVLEPGRRFGHPSRDITLRAPGDRQFARPDRRSVMVEPAAT